MHEYIVQPGDTLDQIADYFCVSVEYIMSENPQLDPENLVAGTRIVIPSSTVARILRRTLNR